MWYLVKTPTLLKNMYSDLIWDIKTEKKEVFLTFDDGPTKGVTPWVLDCLAEYKAKACFFCIGNNVEKHPDIFQRIIVEGHLVGNHTYNHVSGWATKDEIYLEEIAKTAELVDSQLFRPPYGRITRSQIQKIGTKYKTIMWDVLSADFDLSIDANKCYEHVMQNVQTGSIIVFHDSQKCEEKLKVFLPKVLQALQEKGFGFGEITM